MHIFSEDAREAGPSQILNGDDAEEPAWKGSDLFLGIQEGKRC